MGLKTSGSYDKTKNALERLLRGDMYDILDDYGQMGVDLLASATPVNSGLTAASWEYVITNQNGRRGIEWYNTNINDGEVVAILIQYGHGTGTGGYVAGQDYINPAIQPLFDELTDRIVEEVTS